MKLDNITDVFFDLDHTLWDFETNSALTFRNILPKNNVPVDVEAFIQAYVPINFAYWEAFRMEEIDQKQLRYGRLKDSFNAINYDVSDEMIDILAEDYIQVLPSHNHLFEGAFEVLDYLKSKYKLHIITNGFNSIQNHKLINSKIKHYFQTITDSESTGVKKPNPAIFEYAMKVAEVDCKNAVMIGDCVEADVNGALQCGMDAILFQVEPCATYSVKQISTLKELKNFL
jgi:YjjG family noncanonical pyrimidine nucleotidase